MAQNYVPQDGVSNAVITIGVKAYNAAYPSSGFNDLPLLKVTPVDLGEFENMGTQNDKDATTGLPAKVERKTTGGFAIDIETKRFQDITAAELAAITVLNTAGYKGGTANIICVNAAFPGDGGVAKHRYMTVRNFVPFGDDTQKSATLKCRLEQYGPVVTL